MNSRIFSKISISILSVFLILLTCFLVFANTNNPYYDEKPTSKKDIVSNCDDLDLESTAFCLKSNIKTFYNYNSTTGSVKEINSFDFMFENGGNCVNWANLYEDLIRNLRYSSKQISSNHHRFLVIYKGTDACILDQIETPICGDKKTIIEDYTNGLSFDKVKTKSSRESLIKATTELNG